MEQSKRSWRNQMVKVSAAVARRCDSTRDNAGNHIADDKMVILDPSVLSDLNSLHRTILCHVSVEISRRTLLNGVSVCSVTNLGDMNEYVTVITSLMLVSV